MFSIGKVTKWKLNKNKLQLQTHIGLTSKCASWVGFEPGRTFLTGCASILHKRLTGNCTLQFWSFVTVRKLLSICKHQLISSLALCRQNQAESLLLLFERIQSRSTQHRLNRCMSSSVRVRDSDWQLNLITIN